MTQMPLATQIFADFLEIALIKFYHVKYKLMEKEFILQQIEKDRKSTRLNSSHS